MIAFNNSDGMSNINITFELLATLDKAIVTYVLKQKISDFIMWRGSIDTCVITQGILGRYILRSLQSNSKKYGNFSLNCPHRKGFYVIKNLPRVDEKNFASIAPHTRKPWEIKFTIKGKINKSSRYSEVVTFALQGLSFMWNLQ